MSRYTLIHTVQEDASVHRSSWVCIM